MDYYCMIVFLFSFGYCFLCFRVFGIGFLDRLGFLVLFSLISY